MKYLVVLCLMLFGSLVWAQDDPPPVAISAPLMDTSSEIASVYWTPDSQSLIFEEKLILPDEQNNQWYFASVTARGTWTVTKTTAACAQSLMLTDAMSETSQRSIFEFTRGIAYNGEGVVVASPNPNYFVYVGKFQQMGEGLSEGNGPFYAYPLILADISQARSIVVPDVFISDLRNANVTYQINWSFDGTALTVATQSNFGAENLYYVSSYAADLTDIQTTRIRSIEVDDIIRGVSYPFAGLSNDGKAVFLQGITQTSNDLRLDLLMWNVEDPEKSQVLIEDESIVTAAFSPNEESVVFIGRDGLQLANVETGKITLIDATLNRKTVARAWFSPDRQRLALITYEGYDVKLLVVDLP
jgi:hypothetical protein